VTEASIARAFVTGLAALSSSGAPAQDRGSVAPLPDRVAYSTFAPGNWDLYLFERPNEPPRRLTDDPAPDYNAAVSPDGRWLLFTSERRGNPDLYVLELARGGEPRLLIDSDALEDQAAFAPDGASIAFVGTASGNADVYTLSFRPSETVAIGAARNVTKDSGGDFEPAFSPDGRTLAFSSDRGLDVATPGNPRSITRLRSGDLYTLDVATSTTRRLTDAQGWDGSPAWSKDGQEIAFYSERGRRLDHANTGLWIMAADGSQQRALATPAAIGELSPQFLADGRIVYARRIKPYAPGPWDEPGTWQIVTVQPDGQGLTNVSAASTDNYWAPTPGPTPGSIIAHGTGASSDGDERLLIDAGPHLRSIPGREVELYPLRANLGIALHPFEPVVLHSKAIGVDLTLTNLHDGGQRRLVEFTAPRNRPIGFGWSRNAEWIVLSRGGATALTNGPTDGDVWKVRADGSELSNLTPDSPATDDGYPSFSGDGARIVFRRGTRGHYDLYLMKQDGSDVRRLTDGAANYLDPAFSPTAKRIAFLSNGTEPESVLYDVYLMELDDGYAVRSIRQITATDGQEGHVAFSHDGEWLVFTSEQGGISYETPLFPQPQAYGEIYAYRIADGTTVRLTHDWWEDGAPAWEKGVSTR
jgi:Tol biopolymer transport system component